MTVDTSDMLKSIFDTFSGLDYIRPEDIPNIDLYMDQVTTFMEEHLKKTRRHPGDKILTKTMINNYAKNDLLPPPTKKKYSREHMLVLIFIYYFKNLLSITDIQALLKPLTEKYFKNDKDFGMEEVYKEVFSLEKGELEKILGVKKINNQDLKTRLIHLMGNVIEVPDDSIKQGFKLVTLFEEATAEQDDYGLWQVKLECTQKAMKYFFNIEPAIDTSWFFFKIFLSIRFHFFCIFFFFL